VLQVLLRRLAHTEAMLFVLTVRATREGDLLTTKALKDHTYEEVYSKMRAEVERDLTR
jgi:hypothetical protein